MKTENIIKKKAAVIVIATVLVLLAIAGAAFGIYYNNQNNMISSAKEALNVKTEEIIELDNQEHTINVADLIEYNAGDFDSLYSASFDTGEQTLCITANEVNQKEVGVNITVKNVNFVDNVLKYTVKISVSDTTMPVWKETVNEIKVIQGEEIKIAEKFKAEDISGEVEIRVKGEVDNNKIGEQAVIVYAIDKNGNHISQKVKVIVEAKPEETTSASNNNVSANKNSSSGSKNNSSASTGNNNSTTTKPTHCTTNSNHSIKCGNMGRWFNSKKEVERYWEQTDEKYFQQYENGEITYDEYAKKSPYGYKCWSCSYCGKWTGNFKYR